MRGGRDSRSGARRRGACRCDFRPPARSARAARGSACPRCETRRALAPLGGDAAPMPPPRARRRRRSRWARRSSSPAASPSVFLDERLELRHAGSGGIGVTRELVVARRGAQLAPCLGRLAPTRELLGPAERVEHVQLERGPREAALLELARHGEEPLGRGGDVLAGDCPAPGVRACARPRTPCARGRGRPLPRGEPTSAETSSSSKKPSGTSSLASTHASAPALPTSDVSARAPSRSPIAWAKIVFPAPVSPATAFSPGRA